MTWWDMAMLVGVIIMISLLVIYGREAISILREIRDNTRK